MNTKLHTTMECYPQPDPGLSDESFILIQQQQEQHKLYYDSLYFS